MFGIDADRALELLEAAVHVTEEMPHFEIDRRMDRIDFVSVVGAGCETPPQKTAARRRRRRLFMALTLTNRRPLARSFVAETLLQRPEQSRAPARKTPEERLEGRGGIAF